MHVMLQATSGPAAGMRIAVRRGQVVQVGSTEWADFQVPGDSSMSDVHFALEYDYQGCRIRDLNSSSGTLVNGVKVSEQGLHSGDEVAAGGTSFSVVVEEESVPVDQNDSASSQTSTAVAPGDEEAAARQTAADFCRDLELGDEAQQLLNNEMGPAEYLETLTKHELYPDAVRFLAFWLPKPAAVSWGCQCVHETVGEQLPMPEKSALEAAQTWAADPSEENRRAAEAAAEASQPKGAASWVALGAFWSEGSLAPPEAGEVPPAEGLTAQAITGALMIAAPHGDPLVATDRYRRYLELGKAIRAERTAKPTTS